MRSLTLALSILAALSTCVSSLGAPEKVAVYVQAVSVATSPIKRLAEIQYDPSTVLAEIKSYSSPVLSADTELVRIGLYNPATKSWISSTSVTSAESFSKGYAPIITLSLDTRGKVLGVSCRSGKVDAGQTRDFGPKVTVVKTSPGKSPELNKPVVLTKEGKVEEPVPEKTFLQKYWMIGLGLVVMLLVSGGGDK